MERDKDRDRDRSSYHNKKAKKKVCAFCVDKSVSIDYKDVAKLRRYISERAKILPRRITGTCAYHQRELTMAIKRSRHIALIPYSAD
jgi:small subunit ribosomal protein S18